VGVHDPADLGELDVQQAVGRGVDRRSQGPFDHAAVLERHDDHVVRSQPGIRHATRLDDQDARGAVDAAGVAERQRHQPGLVDRPVRGGDRRPEISEVHGRHLTSRAR